MPATGRRERLALASAGVPVPAEGGRRLGTHLPGTGPVLLHRRSSTTSGCRQPGVHRRRPAVHDPISRSAASSSRSSLLASERLEQDLAEPDRIRRLRVLCLVLPRHAADRADVPIYLRCPRSAVTSSTSTPGCRRRLREALILDAPVAGILALGLNYGAYMTEIFRAGIQSINPGQSEAADALGMTLRPEDAQGGAATGVPGDHPADRQRVHRDDEGHRAGVVPRRRRRERRDLPPRRSWLGRPTTGRSRRSSSPPASTGRSPRSSLSSRAGLENR